MWKMYPVKWPNDVYAGERKIAGILIEHTVVGKKVAFSFCGIGLNVNQSRFLSDAPNPVSLVQLTGKEKDLTEALAELLSAIGRRYEQVYDYDKLEKDFVSGLYSSGRYVSLERRARDFRSLCPGYK